MNFSNTTYFSWTKKYNFNNYVIIVKYVPYKYNWDGRVVTKCLCDIVSSSVKVLLKKICQNTFFIRNNLLFYHHLSMEIFLFLDVESHL